MPNETIAAVVLGVLGITVAYFARRDYKARTEADIALKNAIGDVDIKQKQANIDHLEAQTRSELAKYDAMVRVKESEVEAAQSNSNLITLEDLRKEVRELKVEIQGMRTSLTRQADQLVLQSEENATLNANYQIALTKLEERDGSIGELKITIERLDTRIERLREKIETYLGERIASAKKPDDVAAAEGKVSDEKLQVALVDDEATQVTQEPQKTAATTTDTKTEG